MSVCVFSSSYLGSSFLSTSFPGMSFLSALSQVQVSALPPAAMAIVECQSPIFICHSCLIQAFLDYNLFMLLYVQSIFFSIGNYASGAPSASTSWRIRLRSAISISSSPTLTFSLTCASFLAPQRTYVMPSWTMVQVPSASAEADISVFTRVQY